LTDEEKKALDVADEVHRRHAEELRRLAAARREWWEKRLKAKEDER
jgi:hypothetical protein